MAGIKRLKYIQFGLETTPGTPVAATRVWRGKGSLEDTREVIWVPEDVGIVGGTDLTYTPRLGGALKLDAVEATFEQLPYLLAAGVKNVTTGVADGSGEGKIYAYPFPTTTLNTISTYTVECGDDLAADQERAAYAFVTGFTIEGKAGEAVMMSGEMVTREVTLSAKTPTATIPDAEVMLFGKSKLYIDPVSSVIGATQVQGVLLGAKLEVKTGWTPVLTGDQRDHYTHDLNGEELSVVLTLRLKHTSAAQAEKVNWRAETPRQVRWEVFGSSLNQGTGQYNSKRLRVDLAGKWHPFSAIQDEDGVTLVEGTLVAKYNSVANFFAQITVVNKQAQLF